MIRHFREAGVASVPCCERCFIAYRYSPLTDELRGKAAYGNQLQQKAVSGALKALLQTLDCPLKAR